MRLQTDNYRFGNDFGSLVKSLMQVLPGFAKQINAVSEGRVTGSYNAATAAPVSGLHQQGDYIRNSTPQVLGAAGSRYVVKGWICTASGEPGTWAQDRGLTGT